MPDCPLSFHNVRYCLCSRLCVAVQLYIVPLRLPMGVMRVGFDVAYDTKRMSVVYRSLQLDIVCYQSAMYSASSLTLRRLVFFQRRGVARRVIFCPGCMPATPEPSGKVGTGLKAQQTVSRYVTSYKLWLTQGRGSSLLKPASRLCNLGHVPVYLPPATIKHNGWTGTATRTVVLRSAIPRQ